eukprot:TRINITY_DN15137_c0_g1_i1.p1 TRINITY_DN15137_c0_g1~~TRINITY_DN15137_c0_g1_i1.p1  ORF type:complete len:342 (-),score=38.86 TRINITY_DN15137_c0_g1_i1:62-1087(-)
MLALQTAAPRALHVPTQATTATLVAGAPRQHLLSEPVAAQPGHHLSVCAAFAQDGGIPSFGQHDSPAVVGAWMCPQALVRQPVSPSALDRQRQRKRTEDLREQLQRGRVLQTPSSDTDNQACDWPPHRSESRGSRGCCHGAGALLSPGASLLHAQRQALCSPAEPLSAPVAQPAAKCALPVAKPSSKASLTLSRPLASGHSARPLWPPRACLRTDSPASSSLRQGITRRRSASPERRSRSPSPRQGRHCILVPLNRHGPPPQPPKISELGQDGPSKREHAPLGNTPRLTGKRWTARGHRGIQNSPEKRSTVRLKTDVANSSVEVWRCMRHSFSKECSAIGE